MTDEIMPREDRSGKVWAFLGGCIAGIAGLFAVALISELSCPTPSASVGEETFDGEDDATSDIENQVAT